MEVLNASYSRRSSFLADSLNTMSQSAPIALSSTRPETTAIMGVEEAFLSLFLFVFTNIWYHGAYSSGKPCACACLAQRVTTTLAITMKKTIQVILAVGFVLAFIAILLFLSRMQKENIRASLPVSGRLIDLSSVQEAPSSIAAGVGKTSRAKVSPEWGELILDALDLNLDEDEELEQVIVVRQSDSSVRNISIVVADFQPVTGSYFRTWKSETRATKTNAFIVQPRDLLHEGSTELLCFGLDDENRQTLDVFRKIPKRSGYVEIISAAGVDIAIEDEAERSSITVYEALENGSSRLDRKKTLFAWDSRRSKYTARSEVVVPGAAVEQLFLGDTLSGKASDFETYLQGLWLQSDAKVNTEIAIHFDRLNRKLTISDGGDIQEWNWSESNASKAGIYASIANSSLPELIQLLNIELIGMDKIRVRATSQQSVRFATRENWNGVFRRFSDTPARGPEPTLLPLASDQGIVVPLQGQSGSMYLTRTSLYGEYKSTDGMIWKFSSTGFIQSAKNDEIIVRGTYHFFHSGPNVILETVEVSKDGRTHNKTDYIFEVRRDKTVEYFVLKSAKMANGKVKQSFKPDILLSRIDLQGSR